MADQPVTKEKLINADKDVQVIEDFIKKSKDETVTTRFGDQIMTLKGLEEEVKKSGGYFKRYTTLAAANADIANIPVNSVVKVTDAADVGDYEKVSAEATSLTKSAHDPLTQANKHTDDALKAEYIENLYQKPNNVPGFNINPSDGSLRAAANVSINVFPVVAGKTYKLKTKAAINKSYVVIGVATTSTVVANKATSLVTLSDTTDPLIKEFTIPAGVSFAFLNVQWGLVGVDILDDTVVSSQGLEEVVKRVSGKRVYDEELNNRFKILDTLVIKDTDLSLSTTELYNRLNENYNLYIDRVAANLKVWNTSSTVTFPVVAGKTYYIRSPSFLASPCVGLSATQVLSAGGLVDIVYLEDVATGVKKFTVPLGTTKSFAAFTTKLSSQGYDVVGLISVLDTLDPIYIKQIKGFPLTPELPLNLNQRLVDVETKVNTLSDVSPLFGLKWAVIGDSITEKNFRTNKNYHDYVAEAVGGMTIYNYSKSGDTWGDRANVPNTITQDPDIITVFLGTNDFGVGARDFGTFKDGAGVGTVCGSIELLLTNLVNKFPTKRLGILLPLPRFNSYGIDGGAPNSFGYTLRQVSEMIVKYANQFGIPYLDLYNESGLAVYNSDANIYYFTAPSLQTPDGVHPNDLGHQLIARKVRKFLESIV